MKTRLQSSLKHPLISGSVIIFSGTLFANILNFIFTWYMRRELSNADYGVFASLVSLITLPALATAALTPLIVSFAGQYFSKNDLKKEGGFYKYILTRVFTYSSILFILFLIAINQIGEFFRIDNILLLFVTDIIIFLTILLIVNQAFLQARLSFGFITFTNVLGSVLKVVCGLLLVFLGYKTTGAMGALLLSFLVSYIISSLPLRELSGVVNGAKDTIKTKDLFTYGIPSVISMLAIASFITSDILLVKHFFQPDPAGIYAGLSLAGRVIYFFSAPIVTVMFPLVVQKYHKSQNYTNTFFMALVIVLIPSIGLTIFYYLFPDLNLNLFHINESAYQMSALLVRFAFVISLYSVISLVVNFYLSIRRTTVYIPLIVAGVLQIILIWIYHETFQQVIDVNTIILLLLLIILLLYYPYATKKK